MVAVNPLSRGKTPKLTNMEFIVEIMETKQHQKVRQEILSREGKIVEYIDEGKLPYMVISDHPIAEKLQTMHKQQAKQLLKRLPLLLREAVENNVKICYADTFLQKLTSRRSHQIKIPESPLQYRSIETREHTNSTNKSANIFSVRIEDAKGEFQPLQKQIELPVCHTGKDYGISLFHKSDEHLRTKRADEIRKECEGDYEYVNVDSQGAACPKPRDKISGHCEICVGHFDNLQLHFKSKEHQRNISRPGFYDELDQYIGSYIPFIKCPGKPQLLKRSAVSPAFDYEDMRDYEYGETYFGNIQFESE